MNLGTLATGLFALSMVMASGSTSASPLRWRTGGPSRGFVHSFAAAPSNAQRLYAGTGEGLFRSEDGGSTWTRAGGRIEIVSHVAVHPEDETTVYLRTTDALYKSVDGGEVWAPLSAPPSTNVSGILIDPRDGDTIYMASGCDPIFKATSPAWHENAGVYKSIDGGNTWAKASAGLGGFQQCVVALAIDPASPDTLYATPVYTDGGYARSDDGGASWRTAEGMVPGGGVAVNSADPTKRYGITSHPGTPHYLVSEDSGATWNEVMPHVLEEGPLKAYTYDSLKIDPRTGHLFLGTASGAYRSGDGGRSWLPLESAGRDAVRSLQFDDSTGELTIGTVNGVFQSDSYPWNDWRSLPIDFVATGIVKLVTDPSDAASLYAMSGNRIFLTRTLGRQWEPVGEILPSSGSQPFRADDLAVGAQGHVYVVGFAGDKDHLLRLDPGSGTWSELSPPPSPFDSYGRTLKFVTADPGTPGEIYVGQVREIAHSRDGGESWEQLKLPSSFVTALSIDPLDSNVIYAATGIGIMKSSDRGRSWSLKKELDQTRELVKTKIVISRSNPSVLYAFTRFFGPIDRSADGGETWTTVLLNGELTDLAIGVRDPSSLFGSTLHDGVFRSSDGGGELAADRRGASRRRADPFDRRRRQWNLRARGHLESWWLGVAALPAAPADLATIGSRWREPPLAW